MPARRTPASHVVAVDDMRFLWPIVFAYLALVSLSKTLEELSSQSNLSRNLIVVEGDMIDPSDARLGAQAVAAARELSPQSISRISPQIFRHLRQADRILQLRAAPLAHWETMHHLQLKEGQWPDQPGG